MVRGSTKIRGSAQNFPAEKIRRKLNIFSIIALASLAAPLLLGITEAFLIYHGAEYNPVVESISSLGLRSLGWVQTISFLVVGLLIEVFTIGLYFSIRHGIGFKLSMGILVFFGFGLLLIGAFRNQPVEMPQTVEGLIHTVAARTIFALFPMACFLMVPSLKSDQRWQAISGYTMATGVLAAILVVAWAVFSSRINWFGLYERILVTNAAIWIGVMAVHLLRLSLSGGTANAAT